MFIVSLLVTLTWIPLFGGPSAVDDATILRAMNTIVSHFPAESARIQKGVKGVAALWREQDGTPDDFVTFCSENFIGDKDQLKQTFLHLQQHEEVLSGHFNKMLLDLKIPLHLDTGDILPIDMLFGQYNPAAHLTEDLFQNKIAFMVVLNFPFMTLEEKSETYPKWSRLDWAYARVGDEYISRVPAEVYQKISQVTTDADTYIADYNIYMGNLRTEDGKSLFPADLKLISHWGLRDELKAQYADDKGLARQKMIYQVMKRIIQQEIPASVINNEDDTWAPYSNTLFKDGKPSTAEREPDTRYGHFLSTYQAMRLLDPYYPTLPTHIARRFEQDREIPEATVEKLFTDLMSSPEIRRVGALIQKRLGRNLEPFDIWYDGFKSRSTISEDLLDKKVKARYPTLAAFEKDIPNILTSLGFEKGKASFIASKIAVDPARGAGHAWGAEMKSEKSRLRTRVPKDGMNYKGFNIAMHELGHNVEQTLTLHDVDYYELRGVPNTAFTEAFAFVFQGKDLQVLGINVDDPNAKYLETLDKVWAAYEIMGVSLVDMKVWHWLYDHPGATPAQLREAVLSIAKDVWNQYYSDIFGVKDEPILAIYSHMIDGAMYLPDYPLGQLIEFQISHYLEGKNLGEEMPRMCAAGRLIPEAWMKNAVGASISTQPILKATDEALKVVK